MTKLHKNVGRNPEEIPGGRLLAPGETADVDENDPHIKMLVEDGTLADVHDDAPAGGQDQQDQADNRTKDKTTIGGGKQE